MNCQICGRELVLDQTILCASCNDDFEANYEPNREYRKMIERILNEQRMRARMPNCGLKVRNQ